MTEQLQTSIKYKDRHLILADWQSNDYQPIDVYVVHLIDPYTQTQFLKGIFSSLEKAESYQECLFYISEIWKYADDKKLSKEQMKDEYIPIEIQVIDLGEQISACDEK